MSTDEKPDIASWRSIGAAPAGVADHGDDAFTNGAHGFRQLASLLTDVKFIDAIDERLSRRKAA